MKALLQDLLVALVLFACLQLATSPEKAETPTVPCSTDQDCADKNPGVEGLYAFPEKSLHKR